MINNNFLTKEGTEKLKREYYELKTVKLPKLVERLSLARSQGDLTENSEYSAAKEELAFVEDRIAELERILKNVKTLSLRTKSKTVNIGSRVSLEGNGKKEKFLIVSEIESDPSKGKISFKSPIGKALIGKRKGEEVIVEVPLGKIKYKILSIE